MSRRQNAFTIVELMVAIVVMVIVTIGIYELYTNYVRAFTSQDRVVEAQQAARIAIDTLTQDLLRAGYKAGGTTPAVTYAAATALEVQILNEQADIQERIRYRLDGSNNLVRDVYRNTGVWTLQNGLGGSQNLSGVLVSNLRPYDVNADGDTNDPGEAPALEFQYFTEGELALPSTVAHPVPLPLGVATPKDADSPAEAGAATDLTNLRDIRQVRVTLTVRSAQRDPVRNDYVYRTLRADVKPRNAGLMSTIKDSTPPATPTGLASTDRGDCGFLYLSWDENTEPDLGGYVVYYSPVSISSPGVYLFSVTVPRGASHTPLAPYPLPGLTDGETYRIAISAFDYSGNSSALSSELSGTVGTADTTPNIGDPDTAPASFAATGGAGKVTLSWDRVGEPDVIGYRVWRKETGFSNAELLTLASTGALSDPTFRQVADEAMFGGSDPRVTATATGWTLQDDETTELRGCVEYHYAVTPIKGCNIGSARPITAYTVAHFARTGPASATDTTPPSPPSPMLSAYPSYLRNYVTLNNPSTTEPANKDFIYTLLAYKAATTPSYPTFSVNPSTGAVETDGTPVECYGDSYGPGTFTTGGTFPGGITHKGLNGTCAAAYSLDPSVTYYYAAVAVDTCKNLSDPATTQGQVAATQCSDETELGHPAVGNPPAVAGVHGTTERSLGGLTTSEARLAWTPLDDSFNQYRDLAGYYLARTSGDTTATPFPVLSHIWTDPKAPGLLLTPSVTYTDLTEGKINRVRVLAVDCETVTKDDATHSFLQSRYGTSFDSFASRTLIFYPGTLLLDTAVATKNLGKSLNFVEFQTRNTINAAATPAGSDRVELKTLTFDWINLVDGSGKDRLLKSVVIRNGTTTFTLTPPTPVSSGTPLSATGTGFRSATNATFTLEFINSTTGSASQARMRDFAIRASMVYTPVTRLDSDVAVPFVFDSSQQAEVSFTVPAARAPEIRSVWDANSSAVNWHPAVIDPLEKAATVPPPDLYPYPASEPVDILVEVNDVAGKGLERIRVFYAVTAKTASAPPAIGDTLPASAAGYTALPMCDNDASTPAGGCAGSGFYAAFGLIPVQTTQRVWYFVVIEDRGGNFTIAPGQDITATALADTYDHL